VNTIPGHQQFRRRRRVVLALVVAASVSVLGACGGGSNSSSSDPGSPNYDPAHTTLKAAGLEVCGEEQQSAPPGLSQVQGLALTRVFAVAKDCHGATTSPNTMMAFQFTSMETFNAGVPQIKSALPNAAVAQSYPIVIAATGPNKDENLAAVVAQLPKH
jgi:hypothetical protein